jgi:hypothetical protein
MARDIVTSTKLSKNADIADVAGVAINTTNGTSVAHGKQRKTYVVVTNTSGSTRVVTVKRNAAVQDPVASDYSTNPIAATTGVQILGPFDGHYIQADGSIWLDFVSGHTGAVKAYELPA